jgi:hypothetical protein
MFNTFIKKSSPKPLALKPKQPNLFSLIHHKDFFLRGEGQSEFKKRMRDIKIILNKNLSKKKEKSSLNLISERDPL